MIEGATGAQHAHWKDAAATISFPSSSGTMRGAASAAIDELHKHGGRCFFFYKL